MHHEPIIDKYMRKVMRDGYWFGVIVGSMGGLVLGFIMGYGFGL